MLLVTARLKQMQNKIKSSQSESDLNKVSVNAPAVKVGLIHTYQLSSENFSFKNTMSKFTVGAVFYILYGMSEDLLGGLALVIIATLLLLGVQ